MDYNIIRILKNFILLSLFFILLILDICFITKDIGILILLPFYIIPIVVFGILYLLYFLLKSEVDDNG